LLSEATLYLLQHGQYKLAQACLSLAIESEHAVAEKAKVKNKSASAPAHIKFLLRRAQVEASWGFYPVLSHVETIDGGHACALIAEDVFDQIAGHLCAGTACLRSTQELEAALDHFLRAIQLGRDSVELHVMRRHLLLPLDVFLLVSKLLQQFGRFQEATHLLLYGAQIYTSSSICLQLGVNFLRLDKLEEAEEALTEANLLENRNAEIWAMLSILCIHLGPHRVHEAEQCLFQALRLGLSSPSQLRELATTFMSIDKLQAAEDLLRRSLAAEISLSVKGTPNPHTRKLLADVLAGQNLAAKAVEEYKAVLLDATADKQTQLAAADKCLSLLASMGRDDELQTVKNIIYALENDDYNRAAELQEQ
jgi:Flp pilus assembly protein TadD